MLDAYERAINEVTGYELKMSLKRKIGQDRDSKIDWLSVKKICQATDVPKFKNRQEKDCNKKEQKAVEQWKTHGHLPRQLAVQKYIGNCNEVKTAYKIEEYTCKADGYAAKMIKLKNLPVISLPGNDQEYVMQDCQPQYTSSIQN